MKCQIIPKLICTLLINTNFQISMQMNRRLYLISKDKKFSNQFLDHFLINREVVFKVLKLI